jgi:hypothetical protein
VTIRLPLMARGDESGMLTILLLIIVILLLFGGGGYYYRGRGRL